MLPARWPTVRFPVVKRCRSESPPRNERCASGAVPFVGDLSASVACAVRRRSHTPHRQEGTASGNAPLPTNDRLPNRAATTIHSPAGTAYERVRKAGRVWRMPSRVNGAQGRAQMTGEAFTGRSRPASKRGALSSAQRRSRPEPVNDAPTDECPGRIGARGGRSAPGASRTAP
jgi:hypothetical protein